MDKQIKSQEKETYISPDIEIVEIETEQNILQNGSMGGDGDTPNLPPKYW